MPPEAVRVEDRLPPVLLVWHTIKQMASIRIRSRSSSAIQGAIRRQAH